MDKTVYEDGKYSVQDVGRLYIGAKYTLGELLEEEGIMFKFRMLAERYILPEADESDTLETHLYYLDKTSFLVKIYKQMKARVKINILEEKKEFSGKKAVEYVTRTVAVEELVQMTPAEKEIKGVVVQELSVSKIAVMTL